MFVYLFAKGKVKPTIRKTSGFLNSTIDKMDNSLGKYRTDYRLRRQFIRYSRIYIHSMIILVIIVSMGMVIAGFVGLFFPEEIKQNAAQAEVNIFAVPFESLFNELQILGSAIGGLLYFSLFTWKWKGQTPGKRIVGIRVIKLSNKPISLWNSFERVSGYASSASLAFVGFFQYFWDRNHQTTHDKICETIVVMESSLHERAYTTKNLDTEEAFSVGEDVPSQEQITETDKKQDI